MTKLFRFIDWTFFLAAATVVAAAIFVFIIVVDTALLIRNSSQLSYYGLYFYISSVLLQCIFAHGVYALKGGRRG